MASNTQKTDRRRRNKIANQGKVRKRKLRSEGTTPSQAQLFGDEGK